MNHEASNDLPAALAALPPRHRRVAAGLAVVLVVWMGLNLLYSLGDHPLYSPSEARYARTTQVMVNGESSLLVPEFEGEPRLQKPPLVHWVQGVFVKLMGANERAVRLPGVLVSLAAACGVYLFACRMRDPILGLMAAGLTLTLPLWVFVARLAIIDPLFSALWTGAVLAGGCVTCRMTTSDIRHPTSHILFWLFVVLATFTKGPFGLIPVGIVMLWLWLSGQRRRLWHWQWPVGLIAACLPLVIWAVVVWRTQPEAAQLWYHETIQRVTGEGAHPSPWWYFLLLIWPAFFPVTAMLPLPWVHVSPRRINEAFASAHPVAYLAVAVIVPLAIFTAVTGKLPTYIVPLGPPLALIAAWYLRKWLDVGEDHRRITRGHPARGIPNGLLTIAVCTTVGLIGATVAAATPAMRDKVHLDPALSPMLLKLGLQSMLVPALLWVAFVMFRRVQQRVWAVLVLGAAAAAAMSFAMVVENALTIPSSNRKLLAVIDEQAGPNAVITTLGFRDPSLSFYRNQYVRRLGELETMLGQSPQSLAGVPTPSDGGPWVIVSEVKDWQMIQRDAPQFAARFGKLTDWRRPFESWIVMIERDEPPPEVSNPDPP